MAICGNEFCFHRFVSTKLPNCLSILVSTKQRGCYASSNGKTPQTAFGTPKNYICSKEHHVQLGTGVTTSVEKRILIFIKTNSSASVASQSPLNVDLLSVKVELVTGQFRCLQSQCKKHTQKKDKGGKERLLSHMYSI